MPKVHIKIHTFLISPFATSFSVLSVQTWLPARNEKASQTPKADSYPTTDLALSFDFGHLLNDTHSDRLLHVTHGKPSQWRILLERLHTHGFARLESHYGCITTFN